MFEPVSIPAGVLSITVTVLGCVRSVMDAIDNIFDAPDAVTYLTNNLGTVEAAITLLKTV